METLVIGHITALRAIRAARRAYHAVPWEMVGRVEQRHAIEACVPRSGQVDYDELERLGAWAPDEETSPCVLVARRPTRGKNSGLTYKTVRKLPAGALMRVRAGLYVTSPAYTALLCSKGMSMAAVIVLLTELLGTYTMPPEAMGHVARNEAVPGRAARDNVVQAHYSCDPAVSMKELRAMARFAKSSAYATFRAAASYVLAGSASPGETIMAGMLYPPMRFGAFGLCSLPQGGMLLNHRIEFDAMAVHMASGVPYAICDAYIPAANVDVEYNGIGHEEDRYRAHDAKRNNGLKGMGITVLVINREQMRDIVALEALAQAIYKAAGIRFRYQFDGVRARQANWLNSLRKATGLPPI